MSVIVFGMGYDLRFFVAPPLLVFFTEITKRDEKVIKDQETVSEDDKNKIKRQHLSPLQRLSDSVSLSPLSSSLLVG